MEKHPDLILPGKRLGRNPKKAGEYRKVLRAAKYITVERAPKHVDYQSPIEKQIGKFPMLRNDELGDCTCAAKGHGLQIINGTAGRAFTPTDEMIVQAYSESCGYRPNDPNSDQGGIMLDVAKYWRDTGIGGRKILAFARVDLNDRNEVKLAVDLFGGVDLGLSLPISAQQQESDGDIWHVVRGSIAQPGGWGGHDVWASRYDAKHLVCVTWDEQKPMTWGFVTKYADEAYAYVTEDWLDTQGKSVTGLDLAALRKDLEAKIGPIVALNRYVDANVGEC
jgi:hypothetical protein